MTVRYGHPPIPKCLDEGGLRVHINFLRLYGSVGVSILIRVVDCGKFSPNTKVADISMWRIPGMKNILRNKGQ